MSPWYTLLDGYDPTIVETNEADLFGALVSFFGGYPSDSIVNGYSLGTYFLYFTGDSLISNVLLIYACVILPLCLFFAIMWSIPKNILSGFRIFR